MCSQCCRHLQWVYYHRHAQVRELIPNAKLVHELKAGHPPISMGAKVLEIMPIKKKWHWGSALLSYPNPDPWVGHLIGTYCTIYRWDSQTLYLHCKIIQCLFLNTMHVHVYFFTHKNSVFMYLIEFISLLLLLLLLFVWLFWHYQLG